MKRNGLRVVENSPSGLHKERQAATAKPGEFVVRPGFLPTAHPSDYAFFKMINVVTSKHYVSLYYLLPLCQYSKSLTIVVSATSKMIAD
jgi:hypothetical protein